jgi:hypothetical protein
MIDEQFFNNFKKRQICINVVVIIIILCLLYLYLIRYHRVKWTSNKFGYSPKERYYDIEKLYDEPDLIDTESGGCAIWYNKSKIHPFERIQILDEAIPHYHPAKHSDFLYSWYKLPIRAIDDIDKQNKINQIRKLSDSVSYDTLKQLIQVRCHFMGANKATIVLAIMIATGQLTIADIKKDNLYGKYIFKTIKEHQSYDPKIEIKYDKILNDFHNQNQTFSKNL